jgi:hypothetical protein
MIRATRPPEAVLQALADDPTEQHADFETKCGGMRYGFWDTIRRPFLPSYESQLQSFRLPMAQLEVGKPTGTAFFSKKHCEAAAPKFKIRGYDFMEMMEWLQWTLGTTCGVGIDWAEEREETPHINLFALPKSQMRGAIGWCFGPPLARNRTIQLLDALGGQWSPHYFIRTFQHEFGHFLGHYGSGSHSGSRIDIMYWAVQNIAVTAPRSGKSEADVSWERKTFGGPWIKE